MMAYRLYFFGVDGHLVGVEIIETADEGAVIHAARKRAGARPTELWNFDRLAKAFPAMAPGLQH